MSNGETSQIESNLEAWREVLPRCTIVTTGSAQQLPVHVTHGDDVVVSITAVRSPAIDASPVDADSIQELEQLDLWYDPQEIDGELIGRATFEIPATLPVGYYRVELISDSRNATALLLVTPRASGQVNGWGLTLDLPAVRSRRSWGIGDLADLAEVGVLAALVGSDFIYPRPEVFDQLQFEGEEEAPASFLAPQVRQRYVPTAVLRVEEIPEFSYLTAPDRALVEWEAEEFHKLNSTTDPINVPEIHQAKTAALDLIRAVELSPARQAEYDAYVAREGQELADFALWAAIAENCHRTETSWPEDAAEPDSFGARRAGDQLQDEIEKHRRYQWFITQQFERAHQRARGAGMRIGLLRDWQWDPTNADLSDLVREFQLASHGVGGLVATPTAAAEDAQPLLAVLAIEAERAGIEVILAVQNQSEWQAAAQEAGLTTAVNLWRDEPGQRSLNTETFTPAQMLEITTPMDIPLANYLAEEFVEALPTNIEPAQEQELRREAANAHDALVRVLSSAGLIDDDFSQRALIEALHAWAHEQKPRLTALRLRDVVGQRAWAGDTATELRPTTDGFGAPVVVDDLKDMPVLLSLLRRF